VPTQRQHTLAPLVATRLPSNQRRLVRPIAGTLMNTNNLARKDLVFRDRVAEEEIQLSFSQRPYLYRRYAGTALTLAAAKKRLSVSP
jgi:hypothetical protein